MNDILETLYERTSAQILRSGLERIDKMSRAELLRAHGWDNGKSSTERLRKRARLRWISGDHNFNLWV